MLDENAVLVIILTPKCYQFAAAASADHDNTNMTADYLNHMTVLHHHRSTSADRVKHECCFTWLDSKEAYLTDLQISFRVQQQWSLIEP